MCVVSVRVRAHWSDLMPMITTCHTISDKSMTDHSAIMRRFTFCVRYSHLFFSFFPCQLKLSLSPPFIPLIQGKSGERRHNKGVC